MGWERRNNCWYYTRSRRINGRVVRTYFGNGPEAEAAAEEDEMRRMKRLAVRRQEELEQIELAEIERIVIECNATIDLLVRAQMLCLGFHYHRGQWRKRRGFKRMMAESEASRKEPEQQAPAAIAPDTKANPPRRPMPQRPDRRCGPGLIRRPLNHRQKQACMHHSSPQRKQGSVGRRPLVLLPHSPLLALRASVSDRTAKQGVAPRPPPLDTWRTVRRHADDLTAASDHAR